MPLQATTPTPRANRRPAGATQHRTRERAPGLQSAHAGSPHAPPRPEALHAHLNSNAMAGSTTAATRLSRGKHCAMPAVAPKGPRVHGPAGLQVRRQHPVGHTSQQLLDHPTGRPGSCAWPTVRAGAKRRCVRCHGLGHPHRDCHRRTRSRGLTRGTGLWMPPAPPYCCGRRDCAPLPPGSALVLRPQSRTWCLDRRCLEREKKKGLAKSKALLYWLRGKVMSSRLMRTYLTFSID